MVTESKLIISLLASYGLILASPGPNLFVVLRASVVPSIWRPVSAALGVASGATIALGLASFCASFLFSTKWLEVIGTLVFSAVLIRSAIRLVLYSPGASDAALPSVTSIGRVFALGLFAALTNPVTFPFFVGYFVANPASQNDIPLACMVVFLMVAVWFSMVGVVFAKAAARNFAGQSGVYVRRGLAALMISSAVLPLVVLYLK